MNKQWCDDTLVASPLFYSTAFSMAEYKSLMRTLKLDLRMQGPTDSPRIGAFVQHLQCTNGEVACILFMDYEARQADGVTDDQMLAWLAHECVHIWQAMTEMMGESSPSHEFEAYGIQRIFENVLKNFREHQKAALAKRKLQTSSKRSGTGSTPVRRTKKQGAVSTTESAVGYEPANGGSIPPRPSRRRKT